MVKIKGCLLLSLVMLVVLVSGAVAENQNKSGVEPQVLKLPEGPGSISGLGESFEPNLNNGTATYQVKIEVPPGWFFSGPGRGLLLI